MKTSLLPERPLIISPTLAATIGLEEAVMLQVLAELIHGKTSSRRAANPSLEWAELSDSDLKNAFPFWEAIDLRRVQSSLQNLGLIVIDPAADAHSSFYAIDEPNDEQASRSPSPVQATSNDRPAPSSKISAIPSSGGATLIPPNWQPGLDWIKKCQQHSIPEDFIKALVPEFVGYWRERAQARFSWGNAFYKWVLKEWREEQTRKGAFELATEMSPQWRPSDDAVGILEIAGINSSFIEDAIPEFVLYWRERGMVNGAWNTKFIDHIRRQWAKFSASFGYDDTPKVISSDWQPSSDCFEILQLAEIDEEYARKKIPEFVMYWKDSQQVKSSWNTVFLQFIKQDWARQLKQIESADLGYAEINPLLDQASKELKSDSSASLTEVGRNKNAVAAREGVAESTGEFNDGAKLDHVDAINQIFAEFEFAYHNQFHKAFNDSESQIIAKKYWLGSLEQYTPLQIVQAAKQVIRTQDYLPSIAAIVKACDSGLDLFGLPSARSAYLEACGAPSPKRDFPWSHEAVYLAGQAAGWFLLSSEPESVSLPLFEYHYEQLCRRVVNGEKLEAKIAEPLSNKIKKPLGKEETKSRLAKMKEELGL